MAIAEAVRGDLDAMREYHRRALHLAQSRGDVFNILAARLTYVECAAVLGVTDGARAVAAALEWRPRAILLDIQLPGMDGYAVAAALKEQAELAGVPIIAVTSHAMAGDRQRILAAGAGGYIEKPIDPTTFVEEIRRHLAG